MKWKEAEDEEQAFSVSLGQHELVVRQWTVAPAQRNWYGASLYVDKGASAPIASLRANDESDLNRTQYELLGNLYREAYRSVYGRSDEALLSEIYQILRSDQPIGES